MTRNVELEAEAEAFESNNQGQHNQSADTPDPLQAY